MTLAEKVAEAIRSNEEEAGLLMSKELKDAEALADEFAEITPPTFVVPVERMAGLVYSKGQDAAAPTTQHIRILPF